MPPYSLITYDDIVDACEKRSSLINNPPFLRHARASEFIHSGRITATLEGTLPGHTNINELVKYVSKKAKRVFLTLVLSGTLRHINSLYQSDFGDRHLPVSKSQHDKQHMYSQSDKVEAFEGWESCEKDRFVEKQWVFLAPILDEKTFEYEIEEEQPLPLLLVTDPSSAKGHFGAVTKAQMPPDAKDDCIIAVKSLTTGVVEEIVLEKLYQRELTTLEKMRRSDSMHLIKAYAAFKKKRGGQYDRSFIFPWASGGNLASFWAKGPADKEKTFGWALDQILGLADGIKRLHDSKTRHGDIKPENILVFTSDGDDTLVIADVGLAKSHKLYTRNRFEPTTTTHGTPLYEPPETREKNHKLSRKYDVWSFGCVLLQFLIWLVEGPEGINEFLGNFEADRAFFWEANRGSTTVRPVVTIRAKELSRSIKRKVPSDFREPLKDLLRLVQKRLLIVDVDSLEGSRADSKEMLTEIRKIYNKSLPTYQHSPDQSNRLHRSNGPNVAAQDVSILPLSRSGTSQIRDLWEDITDNEIASSIILSLRQAFPSSLTTYDPPICDECKILDLSSNVVHISHNVVAGQNEHEECVLCKLINQVISRAGVVPRKNLELFRTKSTLSTSPGGPPLLSIYSDPGSKVDTSSYAQIGLPWLPEAASSQEFHILREWIRLCDETHVCMRAQKFETRASKLPTRVIYVGKAGDPSLRLVQPSPDLTDKYVALSHCWGRVNRDSDSHLKNGNIKEFMNAISFKKLPKTFRDAIKVTRALGICYLWIDSLCIIQDDEYDWEVESGNMENMYSSAYITIAASSAESSLMGFIHERPARAYAKLITADSPLYIAEAIDDFQADVEGGVLNTRAWVLQERALSRRTVHFTSSQIYWECGKGIHCETLAQLRNPVSQFLGDHDFPNLGLQYFKDERIQLIQYLYMRYSELNLTNDTDRPAAISGLQKRLGRTFKSGADYGIIWKYYLEIPFGKVDWTGDLWKPSPTEEPGSQYGMALRASARRIIVQGSNLPASVKLDMDIRTDFEGSQWRCVTVGKDKTADILGDITYYVLLIRPILADKLRDFYERIGVGTLYEREFSMEVEQVWLL
ncbi:hypothetical protein F4680DRAFT_448744 [Xylaria scruposa]|nr:hypothetical protein F4680DRAFT_448744 [Xylaria scruposa]